MKTLNTTNINIIMNVSQHNNNLPCEKIYPIYFGIPNNPIIFGNV